MGRQKAAKKTRRKGEWRLYLALVAALILGLMIQGRPTSMVGERHHRSDSMPVIQLSDPEPLMSRDPSMDSALVFRFNTATHGTGAARD